MMSLKLTIKVVAFFLGHPVYAGIYIPWWKGQKKILADARRIAEEFIKAALYLCPYMCYVFKKVAERPKNICNQAATDWQPIGE